MTVSQRPYPLRKEQRITHETRRTHLPLWSACTVVREAISKVRVGYMRCVARREARVRPCDRNERRGRETTFDLSMKGMVPSSLRKFWCVTVVNVALVELIRDLRARVSSQRYQQ